MKNKRIDQNSPTSRGREHVRSVAKSLTLLALITGALCGIPDEAQADDEKVAPAEAEGELVLGAGGFLGIPLGGDFGDFVDAALGATFNLRYVLNPQIDLSAKIGFLYYLTDIDAVSFYAIPLWGGARYYPNGREGYFVGGDLAFNRNTVSFDVPGGNVSESNTELGINAIAGIVVGKYRAEGGLYINSIDELADSLMIGVSGGIEF